MDGWVGSAKSLDLDPSPVDMDIDEMKIIE
jgi:hypothetical protein